MLMGTDFWVDGVPQTGLSAVITIYDMSDGSVVVNAAAMSEVAGGAYKYDFAGYDADKNYYIVFDGGATLTGADRYQRGFSNVEGEIDEIQSQVVDTMSEMTQGKPTATPTMAQALMYIYMQMRNKTETTATEFKIHNDAGTCIAKATLSDDGVTFTKSEMETGA